MNRNSAIWKALKKINRVRICSIHKYGLNCIKKQFDNNPKRIFYFGMPEHANMGDLGQYYCVKKWLSANYSEYNVIECVSSVVLDRKSGFDSFFRSVLKPEDILVIHSGYNTNDLSTVSNKLNLYLIGEFKENPIIVLPQTVFFKYEENLRKSSDVFKQHNKLIFMARDEVSYDISCKMIMDGHVMMVPDIVTSLIGTRPEIKERHGIVLCHRHDGEQFYTDADFENIKNKLSYIDKVDIMDTTVSMSYKKILKDLYGAMMSIIGIFEKSRIVITDRYHGMIYSLVSNTPVVVMKTTDHKVIEGYKILKKQYQDRIWFAESPDEAVCIVQDVLESPHYGQLDNYFQREIYGKLRDKIEKELIV